MGSKSCFSSCFAPVLQAFLEEKRALGYKYETEMRILCHFDRYCSCRFSTPILCQEIVQGYVSLDRNRSVHTRQNIICLMRQLAFYLIRHGYPAWVFPKEWFPHREQVYRPYIFTRREIGLFLDRAEKISLSRRFPWRHRTLPLLYRTLYCCGLRVSEATGLTLRNVDLKKGILLIQDAKDFRDRVIPMSDDLSEKYREYHHLVHLFSSPGDYFFSSDYGKRYSIASIEKNFREILWKCGISYQGREKGPHLHDLRHTFSVHCLQNAMKAGREIQEFLPILSAYLGHRTLSGTQRYLHLTAELYPDILEQMEGWGKRIIPGGISHE